MEGGACKKQDLSEMEFVRAEGASMRLIVFEYAVIHAKFSAPANQVSDFPQRDFTGLGVKLLQPVVLWADECIGTIWTHVYIWTVRTSLSPLQFRLGKLGVCPRIHLKSC
jgi:hypothetical protein